MVPVRWEDEWPIVSPGSGRIEWTYPAPDLPEFPIVPPGNRDHFDDDQLDGVWNIIRTPREPFWSLAERPGYLRLRTQPERLSETTNPAFIGRRQQHPNCSAATAMEFAPDSEAEAAGLALFQNDRYHFRYEYARRDGELVLRLAQCAAGVETILAERSLTASRLYLKIRAVGQEYSFDYGVAEDCNETLIEKVDGRILSTDVAGGFVGTYIGMFTSSNGQSSRNHADFDWFEYRKI